MVNNIKEEIPIEQELKKKIEFICNVINLRDRIKTLSLFDLYNIKFIIKKVYIKQPSL